MSGTYQPWSPDRPAGGASGRDANPTVALVIATACLLVLAGALISGLTLDGISGDDDSWKLRAKIVGLSGFSFAGGGGGGIAVGAALAVGAVLAAGSAALAATARLMVGVAAGWLVAVGAAVVVVDVMIAADADDSLGFVLGGTLSDVGTAVLAAGALVLALRRS